MKASSWSWGWICLVGRITGRRRRQRRGDGDDVDAKFDDVEAGRVGGQESVPSSVTNAGRAFFVLDEHESCPCAAGRGFQERDLRLEDEEGGSEINEESEAEEGAETGAGEEALSVGARVGVGVGATLGGDRDGGIEGAFVRHSKDLAFQSIKGFSLSRKGIPRIIDCMPMGATKKVSCKEAPETE